MELNKRKFSLAAGAAMGIAYAACAAFVAIWPDFSLRLLGWLTHLVNVDKPGGVPEITVGGFIIGLLQAVVYTYIGAWIFARLFNKFIQPKS